MSDEKKIIAHSLKCNETVWGRFKDAKDEMDDVTTNNRRWITAFIIIFTYK